MKTKVENTGLGVAAFIGHLSNVAPIGRQNKGTESGIGLLGMSSSGKRARTPLHKFNILIKQKKSTENEIEVYLDGKPCSVAACSSTFCSTGTHQSPTGMKIRIKTKRNMRLC